MDVLDTNGLDTQIAFIKAYIDKQIKAKASIPIGHEYFSMNPNVPQGSLPLFGGIYDRATYPDLWAWVQTQTGYCKTEAEWQTISASNNGNVPFYSDGNGTTTFRVPSLKCWVKGANGTVSEVGSYLEAGLPNIEGSFRFRRITKPDTTVGDLIEYVPDEGSLELNAFRSSHDTATTVNTMQVGTSQSSRQILSFDASHSNSIYGNSTTVQPESIVGLWLVKAYGTVEDTGTIDEQQYIDDRITALPNTFLPLTGGTMTGGISYAGANGRTFSLCFSGEDKENINVGWDFDNAHGAGIAFRSVDYPEQNGVFSLWARDNSAIGLLNGYPNGSLQWRKKEIERVYASGSNYIRFESGLQLCWGTCTSFTNGVGVVTFPVAFINLDWSAALTGMPVGEGAGAGRVTSINVESKLTTGFRMTILNLSNHDQITWTGWMAIGKWK